MCKGWLWQWKRIESERLNNTILEVTWCQCRRKVLEGILWELDLHKDPSLITYQRELQYTQGMIEGLVRNGQCCGGQQWVWWVNWMQCKRSLTDWTWGINLFSWWIANMRQYSKSSPTLTKFWVYSSHWQFNDFGLTASSSSPNQFVQGGGRR